MGPVGPVLTLFAKLPLKRGSFLTLFHRTESGVSSGVKSCVKRGVISGVFSCF